jgi:hypothetical protein
LWKVSVQVEFATVNTTAASSLGPCAPRWQHRYWPYALLHVKGHEEEHFYLGMCAFP